MNFDKEKYDTYIAQGLCAGMHSDSGQVCIEAAISLALGEGLRDEPSCVHPRISELTITLNDNEWSSSEARAQGLYKLGLAQLGTRVGAKYILYGNIASHMLDKIIKRKVLPALKTIYTEPQYQEELAKLEERSDLLRLRNFTTFCDRRLTMVIGLDTLNSNLYHHYFLSALSNIKLLQKADPILTDEDLVYVADLATETLEELGHSNEFDSIWKKQKETTHEV